MCILGNSSVKKTRKRWTSSLLTHKYVYELEQRYLTQKYLIACKKKRLPKKPRLTEKKKTSQNLVSKSKL